MERGGKFASRYEAHVGAAGLDLYNRLSTDERFITPFEPEMDIVIWAPRADSVSEMSKLSQRFFDAAAKRNLHLAVTRLPTQFFEGVDDIVKDQETVACVRSCLMKPEHKDWLNAIYKVIDQTYADISV